MANNTKVDIKPKTASQAASQTALLADRINAAITKAGSPFTIEYHPVGSGGHLVPFKTQNSVTVRASLDEERAWKAMENLARQVVELEKIVGD